MCPEPPEYNPLMLRSPQEVNMVLECAINEVLCVGRQCAIGKWIYICLYTWSLQVEFELGILCSKWYAKMYGEVCFSASGGTT